MIALPDDDNRDGIALTGETQTLPEYIKGTPPAIESLRKRFDEARADGDSTRVNQQKDRDYYDGPGQLASIRAELIKRGQPQIYTNRIRPAVNGVLGVLEAGRRDPRGVPRNPDDDDSADICTKTLRYINDESKFNDTQMDVAENFFIEGTGAVIIEMADDKIVATQIRWEEFYYDKFSRRPDLKDARYMGIAKWKDAEEIRQTWNVRINEIGDPMRPSDAGMFGTGFEDRGDGSLGWIDTRRRRCMLVEEYAIVEGEWKRIVYIAAGILEYGPSPYLDDKRRPCNPIEAVSCYVDRNNARYGMVRDMVPIQDEVNASRSRAQHLMNSTRVQQTDANAPPVDPDTVRSEMIRADGVVPPGWQEIPSTAMVSAQLERMQDAKSEIERMGPAPGARDLTQGSAVSGRARQIASQAGLGELARPLGRFHGWVLRCYEQFWNRAKQFKTDPWFIRITDEAKAPEFVKANEPMSLPDAIKAASEGDKQAHDAVEQLLPGVVDAMAAGDPQAMAALDQAVQQLGDTPIMVKNRLAQIDTDIILDQDEDVASLQQEVWGEIVQMVGQAGGIQMVFSPEFELMIEASPLADKRRILDLIKKAREEKDQNQMQQMAQQIQQLTEQLQAKEQTSQAETAANVEHKQSETMRNLAGAHKTAAEADQTQAQTYAALGINPIEALADND